MSAHRNINFVCATALPQACTCKVLHHVFNDGEANVAAAQARHLGCCWRCRPRRCTSAPPDLVQNLMIVADALSAEMSNLCFPCSYAAELVAREEAALGLVREMLGYEGREVCTC